MHLSLSKSAYYYLKKVNNPVKIIIKYCEYFNLTYFSLYAITKRDTYILQY